jgi:hypothetical protein
MIYSRMIKKKIDRMIFDRMIKKENTDNHEKEDPPSQCLRRDKEEFFARRHEEHTRACERGFNH